MQRSGAVLHDDDTGEVTMVLRIPPGSGVTFENSKSEIKVTRTLKHGEHHTLLADWRLLAQAGKKPPFVLIEVDLLSPDEPPNTATAGIQLTYSSVSLAALLAGVAAAVIAALLIAKRRTRDGETHREFDASRSEPLMDEYDSSAGPESGRDRSRPTFR